MNVVRPLCARANIAECITGLRWTRVWVCDRDHTSHQRACNKTEATRMRWRCVAMRCDSGSYAQNHFRIEPFLTASRRPFAVLWGDPGLPCLVRINSHPVVVVDHLLLFAHEIASSLMIQRVYNILCIAYTCYTTLQCARVRSRIIFLRSCTAFYDPSGVCVVCWQRRCPVALSSTSSSSSSSSSAWILLAAVVRTE